jgi:hypothetical protein
MEQKRTPFGIVLINHNSFYLYFALSVLVGIASLTDFTDTHMWFELYSFRPRGDTPRIIYYNFSLSLSLSPYLSFCKYTHPQIAHLYVNSCKHTFTHKYTHNFEDNYYSDYCTVILYYWSLSGERNSFFFFFFLSHRIG